MEIKIAGENSLICYFNAADLKTNNRQAMALAQLLTEANHGWLIDVTPAYQSVLVTYDALQTDHLAIKHFLRLCKLNTSTVLTCQPQRLEIPILYNYPQNNDLEKMAEQHQMSVQSIIELHEKQVYQVYAIGFSPGFAFLGEVDERIATPRLATPRTSVPKGAVGIADRQTAVYPNSSPGGWNIIGLCPTQFFTPDLTPPIPLKVGDEVKFSAISPEEFQRLGGRY